MGRFTPATSLLWMPSTTFCATLQGVAPNTSVSTSAWGVPSWASSAWAAALAASTDQIACITTSHVPTVHPLFAEDLVLMRAVGMRPVVVHGGGPQISDLMTRLGKVTEFRRGLRVTDAETVDIARMVLIGQVNPQLVSAINVHGPIAVGVSGEDAGMIKAQARDPELGFVGDVTSVNPMILESLLADGFIPVVATIGTDDQGQAYNINADTVAGAIAEALHAEKLVYLTDIEGLRRVVDDPGSLIRQTTPDELDQLIVDGIIAGGMIPKVETCIYALEQGVEAVVILDGKVPHAVLIELFTDTGSGTIIRPAGFRDARVKPEHDALPLTLSRTLACQARL
eukprot:gene17253-35631_t